MVLDSSGISSHDVGATAQDHDDDQDGGDGSAEAEAQLMADMAATTPRRPFEGDPTLPQMPTETGPDLEQLLPGIRSHSQTPAPVKVQEQVFKKSASPNFPFDIASAGQAVQPVELAPIHSSSTAVQPELLTSPIIEQISALEPAHQLQEAKPADPSEHAQPGDIAGEDLAQDLASDTNRPTQPDEDQAVPRSSEHSGAGVSGEVDGTSNLSKTAQSSPIDLALSNIGGGEAEANLAATTGKVIPSPDDQVTTKLDDNAQGLSSSPAKMPVKLPTPFHESVLAEAVSRGATEEEQYYIMEGMRAAERQAGLDELSKVEGAIEVDEEALASRTIVGPPAPAEPPTPPGNKGRKRKNDVGEEGANAKKPKAKIEALSDEEHLAEGWTYRPRSDFDSWKKPQLDSYIRGIASQKRWWNGLTKKATIDKIMQWQETMKTLRMGSRWVADAYGTAVESRFQIPAVLHGQTDCSS